MLSISHLVINDRVVRIKLTHLRGKEFLGQLLSILEYEILFMRKEYPVILTNSYWSSLYFSMCNA